MVGGVVQGSVKMSLDLAIGETSKIESNDKGKIADIVQKVRDLKSRLEDVRREQVFQRVSFNFFCPCKMSLLHELSASVRRTHC